MSVLQVSKKKIEALRRFLQTTDFRQSNSKSAITAHLCQIVYDLLIICGICLLYGVYVVDGCKINILSP